MLRLRIILHLLSFLISILLCIFIWSKGFKKKANLYVGLTALVVGLYALTNAIFLSQKTLLTLSMCWIGLFALPVYTGLSLCFRDKKPTFKNLYHLFFLGAILFSLFFTPLFTTKIEYHNEVIVLKRGLLDTIARLFINYYFLYGFYHLIMGYKESQGIKRRQIKYFIVGTSLYTVIVIIYAGILPLIQGVFYDDIPALFSVIWTGFTVYAIIRYRLMDIDTVIHRTILWMLTSSVIFIPISVIIYLLRPWLANLNWIQLAFLTTVLVYVYLYFYPKVQPKIDHLFRRRKYDYQTILGKIAEKIATTISIQDLTQQLLTEICETMYLRNSIFYVLTKDETAYSIIGRRGYKEIDGIRQRSTLEIYTEEEKKKPLLIEQEELKQCSSICKWLTEHRDVLEREQIEVDPQYEIIKQEALNWFKEQDVEVLVPLVVKDKINALLGLGKKENLQAYTVKDIELLKKLGQEAGVTVFNALHYEELVEKKRLDDEMRLGRDIQMNLLPRQSPRLPGINVTGLMIPAKEIGGDYYDYMPTIINLGERPEERLGIVIGDVSGKGVAAGLIMATAKATLKGLSQQDLTPKQILSQANKVLFEYTSGQKFMTMLYFQYKENRNALSYSSAGHEHILIYRAVTANVESIMSGGFMLGMIADINHFLEDREINLSHGDKVILYTDGVTEARNPNEDLFSLRRLISIIEKHGSDPAVKLLETIKQEVYNFIGSREQYDDITLVVMEAT